MKALRTRLFFWLTATIALIGCLGGLFAYFWAFSEAIEMQDSVLAQIGNFAQQGRFEGGRAIPGVDADADIIVVELHGAACSTSDECQLSALGDGLHTASLNEAPVRAFLTTRSDGSRFAVTQRTFIREELAGDLAIRALLPITATIPCLMLVTAFVVARSLRPMAILAGDLDARRANDLTALPFHHAPSELVPFIASINALLERVGIMIDRQRRFVADAAHELRTPITALILQAENLESISLSLEARQRLITLQDGMRRTKHLLDQLLSLAREDASPPIHAGTTALDHVAMETVADLLPMATHKMVDLGFTHIEPITTKGPPIVLATLIRNLVDNAVRFTPSGGRVDIELCREGNVAILHIEDTGPGVQPNDLHRVFEPFFRSNCGSEEGTGLGLAIVRRIVERLGGSIVLVNVNEPARTGLRVVVRLPLADSVRVSVDAGLADAVTWPV